MNQYGFAGGDPVNRSDPFGLCSAPADSVEFEVTVDCGDNTTSTKKVWVTETMSAEEITAVLEAASRLTGGSAEFNPFEVGLMYQGVARAGNLFVLPASVEGYPVLNGGATQTGAQSGAVAFTRPVIFALMGGNLGQMIGKYDVANIVGHEGAHLLNADENQAYALSWGFRP
jgi:hypothetical protein